MKCIAEFLDQIFLCDSEARLMIQKEKKNQHWRSGIPFTDGNDCKFRILNTEQSCWDKFRE